jgi:hypothetical protein
MTTHVENAWFAFNAGDPLVHAVWLTRDGQALSWCVDARQSVASLRPARRRDRVCRACWDATGAGAA